MKVRYTIHDYAGQKGHDRTVEVEGKQARQLANIQATKMERFYGITILEVTRDQTQEGVANANAK